MNERPHQTPTRRKEVTNMAKTETKEPVTFTPKALAEELNVDAKRIRAFLRTTSPRQAEAKNTTWLLDEATAELVRERFTPKAADSEES
jgi:hypothetical protein